MQRAETYYGTGASRAGQPSPQLLCERVDGVQGGSKQVARAALQDCPSWQPCPAPSTNCRRRPHAQGRCQAASGEADPGGFCSSQVGQKGGRASSVRCLPPAAHHLSTRHAASWLPHACTPAVPPRQVFTLGGSVTRGLGASRPEHNYPNRFFAALNATWPHARHTFSNKGIGERAPRMGSSLPSRWRSIPACWECWQHAESPPCLH